MDRIDAEFELRVCNAMDEVQDRWSAEHGHDKDFFLLSTEISNRLAEVSRFFKIGLSFDGKWVLELEESYPAMDFQTKVAEGLIR